MILVDTNLLLHAGVMGSERHDEARDWLDGEFARGTRVALPWHSLLGFVRLASSRAIFSAGPPVADAWALVRTWLSLPNVWTPNPTARHGEVIEQLLATVWVTSRLVMDVHVAALTIEHGLTLCSADREFARFPGLRWRNPLDA